MSLLSKKMLLTITPFGLKNNRSEIDALIDSGALSVVREERKRKEPKEKERREGEAPLPPTGGGLGHGPRQGIRNKQRQRENLIREELSAQATFNKFCALYKSKFGMEYTGTRIKSLKTISRLRTSYGANDVRLMLHWYFSNLDNFPMFRESDRNPSPKLPTVETFWLHRAECFLYGVKQGRKDSPAPAKSQARLCQCGEEAVFQDHKGRWVCSRKCSME